MISAQSYSFYMVTSYSGDHATWRRNNHGYHTHHEYLKLNLQDHALSHSISH
jgi:hypothetical protein